MTSFVHGTLFWGGIGLVSIPIIIHLITRRRFRRLEWAAMEFLLEALKKNHRRVRLEQLILLLCRVAVVALIVMAVARPHLSQDRFGWLSGPLTVAEDKVFLLDDSLSMAHVEAGLSSLDRALSALTSAVNEIHDKRGYDVVSVYRSSQYEAPRVQPSELDRNRLDYIESELKSTKSTAVRLDLAAALEYQANSTSPERGRSVYVLTDLNTVDWTDGQGGQNEALGAALERLAGSEKNARVVVIDVGPTLRDNIAITGLDLETRHPVVGEATDLTIEVTNYGSKFARDLRLRLSTETSVVPGLRVAEIAPGKTATIPVSYSFSTTGPQWITAELDGVYDGLAKDDRRTLVVPVADSIPVLLVDGEPSGVPGEGESYFLNAHFQSDRTSPDRTVFTPTVAVESNLPQDGLDQFGAIFLTNLSTIPDDFVAPLSEYVRSGGALILFSGDQVDSTDYASKLGSGTTEQPGADLLPAIIGDPSGDPLKPVMITPDFDHAAFRTVRDVAVLLKQVAVARFRLLEPHPDARVFARLTDPDESPLLVERQVGDGRVIVVATAADVEWTNWAREPAFPIMLKDLLGVILKSSGSGWTRLAGPPIDTRIELARYQREAIFQPPDFPSSPKQRLLATPLDDSPPESDLASNRDDANKDSASGDIANAKAFRFVIDRTQTSGIYTVTLKTLAGAEEVRRIAINAAPQESDLTPVDADSIIKLYEGVELSVVKGTDASLASDRGRFEIADLLLIMLLVLLLVETTLAWLFAHHRRSAPATPDSPGTSRRVRGWRSLESAATVAPTARAAASAGIPSEGAET